MSDYDDFFSIFGGETNEFSQEEIKKDLAAYWEHMSKNQVYSCIRIEEKYMLFGATPEYVTTTLQGMIKKDA